MDKISHKFNISTESKAAGGILALIEFPVAYGGVASNLDAIGVENPVAHLAIGLTASSLLAYFTYKVASLGLSAWKEGPENLLVKQTNPDTLSP